MTTLHVLTGLPGSGKTALAARLLEAEPGVHVAMDDAVLARGLSLVDYEARFALQPEVKATIPPLLASGTTVVAEFGSWARDERDRLRSLADGTGARTVLHWVDVPVDVCIARVLERGGEDARALADGVLRDSAHLYEAPTAEEGAAYDGFEIVR
ncbi:ATP-binding protein [Demequina sp. NBRC 110053]|uniref:AAA family ATPase n=1 Tax=Demequina sp. NBRC 110053 TaxID=1570342 RepID=UPI0013563CB9|nr:ATP-binding protein [Demequina sp. NBRC 110053]